MEYVLLLALLFIAELGYFKLADKYNIIDKPNERSSHTQITLRGGGIIFYLGVLAYFVYSGFEYPWFFLGLTLMTAISFLDDVFTLSNKIRLSIHLTSVLLLFYQLGAFELPIFIILIGLVVVIGTINAYNFMDGINGITASYSLAVLGLLVLINNDLHFVAQDLILYTGIATLVFGFFNFRNKAKCFAGDVGSVSMAFIVIFILGSLIIATQNLLYVLLISVYGIDTVWTIVRRLLRKENIFQAHRSHLYQFLSNEAGNNKLVVSFVYGALQFIIGLGVIYASHQSVEFQWIFGIGLLVVMSGVYLAVKQRVIGKYVKESEL